MSKSNDSIAIDFGNSACCVAYSKDDKVEVLANTPSFLFFDSNSTRNPRIILGHAAKTEWAERQPECGIFDLKKFIGTNFNCVISNYRNDYPFSIEPNAFKKCLIKVPGDDVDSWKTDENLCKTLFTMLKSNVEVQSGRKFDNVVVTVPPYFDEYQVDILKAASNGAGFKKVGFIYEPMAVLKCAKTQTRQLTDEVIVCDIGGSSFDISVIKVEGNNMELLFSTCDKSLGGIDFDHALLNHVCEKLKCYYNFNIVGRDNLRRKLLNVCEKSKNIFSGSEKFVCINTRDLIRDLPFDLPRKSAQPLFISRKVFEDVTLNLVKKYKENLTRFKNNYGVDRREVFVCGGFSKSPKIKSELKSFFTENVVTFLQNPAWCVAEGAAVYAAEIFGKDQNYLNSHNNSSFSCVVSPPNLLEKKKWFDPAIF